MSEGIDKGEGRKGAAKLLGGRISCIVGILGYFLGARRLGTVTIVLGVAAVFFMAAAATGLIPGVEPLGHGYD